MGLTHKKSKKPLNCSCRARPANASVVAELALLMESNYIYTCDGLIVAFFEEGEISGPEEKD